MPALTFCSLDSLQQSSINTESLNLKSLAENAVASDDLDRLFDDFIIEAAAPAQDTFRYCEWQGEPFDCSAFARKRVLDLGVSCYTLEVDASDVTLRAYEAGDDHSLFIVIDLNQNSSRTVGQALSAGVRFIAHHPDKWPLVSAEGRALAPGFTHFIGLQREDISRLAEPYAKEGCISTDDQPGYNYEFCLRECTLAQVADACGCESRDTCQMRHVVSGCIANATRGAVRSACEQCKRNCDETKFHAVTSSALFPAQGVEEQVREMANLTHYDASELRENVLLVRVYFATMTRVESQHRAAIDESDLLASMGGLCGLFMGASVVTICELVEVLLHLTHRALARFGKNRKLARHNDVTHVDDDVGKT